VLGGVAHAQGADGDCATELARRVQKHYESVNDLAAQFEQTTQVATLGTSGATKPTQSSGRAVFAKPGRMRWHYTRPSESLVVSDGKIAWIYDQAAHEVQRLPGAEGLLSGAAVQFLVGRGDLLRDFHVRAIDCDADPFRIELTPVEPATYEKLEIAADAKSGEVRETAIFDLVGNVTRISFRDVQTNRNPPASTFTFEPPEGVRVVELPPAAP
jgi:outer membrane lipoprotein carrier protein